MTHICEDDVFEFESSDSLAQFAVLLSLLYGGVIFAFFRFGWVGWKGLAVFVAVCFILIAGVRSSIAVQRDRVVIKRKWFFIPYRTYSAPYIEYVCFGGDYGFDEGAAGVVVTMGGRDFHLGNSKNMRFLHDALYVFAKSGKS
jgi:hypothetical protein